jgi:hypothetical protein
VTPSKRLSISDAFASLKKHAETNREILIRMTLLFAVASTAFVPFRQGGALGQSLELGLSLLLSTAYSGMVAAMICLPGEKEKTGTGLWVTVKPLLSRLIWATLIVTVAIAFSILLVVVPFILATIWAVVVPVIVVENLDALKALSRSRQLIAGNGWRVFGFLVCVGLITLAILLFGLILAVPFGDGLAGMMISNFLVVLIAYPLLLSAPAVLYNELREEPVPEDRVPQPELNGSAEP